MKTKINYFALLITIAVGVTAGNLASNWITVRYVVTEIEKEVTATEPNVMPKEIIESTQPVIKHKKKPKVQENIKQEQLMKQREVDDTGLRLAKNCSEWQVAHKDMQTQTSKTGMTKHCNAYQQYIETGEIPPLH